MVKYLLQRSIYNMKFTGSLKSVLQYLEVNYSNPMVRVHSDDIGCQEHSIRWLLSHKSILDLDEESTWEVLSGGDYYDYDIYQGEVL